MKKLKVLLPLILQIALFTITVKSQSNLQSKFDSLIPRQTNLEQIEKILGKPYSQTKIAEWSGKLRKNGGFSAFAYENTPCRNDVTYNFIKRNFYELNYPDFGLTLRVFDNPWNLYSVETVSSEISVKNVKVGDKLERIEEMFGKGDWNTTEGSNYWTLEYEKESIRFIFARDLSVRQFPLKLAEEKAVVRIEKVDRTTHFAGCSKSDNY